MGDRIDDEIVTAITARVLQELRPQPRPPAGVHDEPDRQPFLSFGEEVHACATTAGKRRIPTGVSARHAHVTPDVLEALFGKDASLSVYTELYQPGEFAANETIGVVGPRMRAIEKVRILGPVRKYTQVELSATDCITLGVDAPIRNSGLLDEAAYVTIVGPRGSMYVRAAIRATRHIPLNPTEASYYGVSDGPYVRVRIPGERALTFENVLIRVSPKVIAQMHLDTDDSNAAGLRGGEGIELIIC